MYKNELPLLRINIPSTYPSLWFYQASQIQDIRKMNFYEFILSFSVQLKESNKQRDGAETLTRELQGGWFTLSERVNSS